MDAVFHKRTRANGTVTRRGRCVDCERRAAREWARSNPERRRDRKREWYARQTPEYRSIKHLESRIRKMGYSPADVVEIVEWMQEHGPHCDICQREPSGYRWERLHLDHDDATGAIRGLLCPPCNMSLGKFDHKADRIQRAADYLREKPVFEPKTKVPA